METPDLVTYSYEKGKRALEKKEFESLKKQGQFLTPPTIARLMAKQGDNLKRRIPILYLGKQIFLFKNSQ